MARRPWVFTIGAHRSFADALAAGLIAEHGKDPLGLARGRILLPNNRAVRTVTEAFVRLSGNGMLLPRMAVIGDLDLDETLGPLALGASSTALARRRSSSLKGERSTADRSTGACSAYISVCRAIKRSLSRARIASSSPCFDPKW